MLVFGTRLLKRLSFVISSSRRRLTDLRNLSRGERVEHLRRMALPKTRENPVILKLDSPQFKSVFSDELKMLASMFSQYNYEVRIAGGAVRDLLLGKTPKDLDLATTATPDQMKEMFARENVRLINMNGEKHGTITPRINDKENFEVTTLRIDVVTDGRHAEVQFITDWMLDALRRDLTINSMFLALDGSVYDFFYGYEDLQAKKVKFVGDVATRIQEDYLRILRYFRFYGRISERPDDHEEATLKAITDNKEGLGRVAGERIWVELKKTLEGNFAGEILKRIVQCGLAPLIGLPAEPNLAELELVWKRSAHQKLNAITLLSALLRIQDDAVALNARLKLSAFERDLASFVVQHRDPKLHPNPLRPYKELVVKSKLRSPHQTVLEVLKYNNSPFVEEFERWSIPKFPVSGGMLKSCGVDVGREMGRVVDELKVYWAENDFKCGPEELLEKVPDVLDVLKARKNRIKAEQAS